MRAVDSRMFMQFLDLKMNYGGSSVGVYTYIFVFLTE